MCAMKAESWAAALGPKTDGRRGNPATPCTSSAPPTAYQLPLCNIFAERWIDAMAPRLFLLAEAFELWFAATVNPHLFLSLSPSP
ncbi:unnamed protein product [Caenorhabditis auriculariae]|uniref:Uncharacterized protein n=1 Tax=Caenorhabditis auriculariae TaxID=2777116 RepID=A0A8S1HQF3_9PELO|nr:unnamed protein product [Caenorhabditis auriculariae]